MNFDPNPLFHEIVKLYNDNRKDGDKVVICNEGGTRSSKTWDFFHFIVAFCDHNRNKWNDIYILRDTLINCRDFTLKEFESCLKVIGIWDQSKFKSFPKPYYNLFGNNIFFRGLDDEDNSEGYPSDIIFVNEALETARSQSIGIKMRCRKLFVMDWNPKFTDHWCFDMEKQPNTFFTHSTYKNNKHLQKSIITEIESYEPWLPESYTISGNIIIYNGEPISVANYPPPHPTNIDNNTADEFRWKVYGLGLRGAMKGLIFGNVTYIDEFPDMAYTYGLDFGFTVDPTALVRHAEDENNMYLELLSYEPMDSPHIINDFMEALGIEKNIPITADSSDKHINDRGSFEMVSSLFDMGWEISKVSKTGSVMLHIGTMKRKKIHIIKNHLWNYAKKEQENYRIKEINGISINQPVDKFNHFWDSGRYSHMAHKLSDLQAEWT